MALEEGARMSFEKPPCAKGGKKWCISICFYERAAGSQLCCLLGSWTDTPVCIAAFSLPWGGLVVWLMVEHTPTVLEKLCSSFQNAERGYRCQLLLLHM